MDNSIRVNFPPVSLKVRTDSMFCRLMLFLPSFVSWRSIPEQDHFVTVLNLSFLFSVFCLSCELFPLLNGYCFISRLLLLFISF